MNAWMRRALRISAIFYLIVLLLICGSMRFDGGSHWLVTLFLYGPRWTIALPLLLLVPLTLAYYARLTWIYLLHGVVIVFPILGFVLIGSPTDSSYRGTQLRLMTCNLGGGSTCADEIVSRARAVEAQLLMLQECPAVVAESVFERLGWSHRQEGNIAMGSVFKLGPSEVLARHPATHYNAVAAVACDIELLPADDVNGQAESGTARLVCVHLPTFRPALRAARRFEVSSSKEFHAVASRYRDLVDQLQAKLSPSQRPTIVAGDFNVPVESTFYREYWTEFTNAHDQTGIGLGYTKYTRYHGIRIDHVLADRCWTVDSARVGEGLGGDHRPVIVSLSLAR